MSDNVPDNDSQKDNAPQNGKASNDPAAGIQIGAATAAGGNRKTHTWNVEI